MEEIKKTGNHKLILDGRKKGSITGVLDVVSFDARAILLETELGLLTICGEDIHVNRLTLEKGEVELDGKFDSVQYSDKKVMGEDSFFKKMFR
ncbi:MAG: hypothetical protein PWP24_744 [Clostridiales bacterium]|nr:hypothetical protein [Clostridiales bacterium]